MYNTLVLFSSRPLVCRGGGMVDTLDSKSGVLHGRTGSNPVRGTNKKARHIDELFYNLLFSVFCYLLKSEKV